MVLFVLVFLSLTFGISGYDLSVATERQAPDSYSVKLNFKLNPDELLLAEPFTLTSDTPGVTISKLSASVPATTQFDAVSKESKEIYAGDVTLSATVTKNPEQKARALSLVATFFINTLKKPQQRVIDLTWAKDAGVDVQADAQARSTSVKESSSSSLGHQGLMGSFIPDTINYIKKSTSAWRKTLSGLFESTGSAWLRLLVAFILGVLLSLTPCLYPMIPITVGILQANASKSIINNFLLAGSYTLGISCTFALLGLITALSSSVFGQLQNTAWISLPLILLLLYLGGAMFGFYEMYIPKFLQPKSTKIKGGSHLSAFIFGIISGTVASPCLSPGLALILAHVAKSTQTATIASYISGFSTLFVFGIGSSLPLLIIGTFSNSMNVLPRAGMWMVEVKRILGLLLIGMAFFHMEKFIPWYLLSFIIALFLFIIGVYYLVHILEHDTKATRFYKQCMAVLFIFSACIMLYSGLKALMGGELALHQEQSLWSTDYESARRLAQEQKKKLLLDFATSYCAACTVLDKTIFSDPVVQKAMKEFVMVKIDGTDTTAQPFAHLAEVIGIKGFPTIVVLDPARETVTKKWVGEVGTKEEFIAELNSLR